jgi:hypothetical protein
MSKEMNNAQRSAAHDTVPEALLEIHQRLLEDGAAWRDELSVGATPSTKAGVEPMTPQRSTIERHRSGTIQAQPTHTPRRDVSWSRRLIASAAIIVVVGLLAALVATFARGRGETRSAAPPTPGPLASWSVAPHLATEPVPPLLAPSDPSVVYEARITGANSEHVFRRSDDAGATWRNLPVPDSILGAYTLSYLAVWVDPANAKNVIATLSRQTPPEENDRLCPTVRATVAFALQGALAPSMPASGAGGCHLQYFSADGGEILV